MNESAPAPNAPNSRTAALTSLHLAVALFGFAGLFGKWIALSPTTIVLGRTVVAATALGMMLAIRGQLRGRFEWRLGLNGAVLAVHWVAFFQAIQIAGVAVGLLGFATFPVFVLLLECIFLRRRTQPGEWVLAAIAMLGLTQSMALFVIAFGAIWPMLLATVHGFAAVEPRLYEVARSLHMSRLAIIFKIALPSASPDILSGMRLSLTVALILSVVCEILAGLDGLGPHDRPERLAGGGRPRAPGRGGAVDGSRVPPELEREDQLSHGSKTMSPRPSSPAASARKASFASSRP